MSMMFTLVTMDFSQTACMDHRSRKRSGLLDVSMNVALCDSLRYAAKRLRLFFAE